MKRKLIFCFLFLLGLSLVGCDGKKEANSEFLNEPTISNPSSYLEVGKTRGLKVDGVSGKGTKDGYEKYLQDILNSWTYYEELSDTTVKKDSIIKADYSVTYHGKVVDLLVGYDNVLFLDHGDLKFGNDLDLGKALVGHKKGETVKIEGTLPKDYKDKTYAGKKCVAEAKILGLYQEVVPTEFTDELVQQNEGYDSVDEFKKEVKKEYLSIIKEQSEAYNRRQVEDSVLDGAKVKKNFPKDMIKAEEDFLRAKVAQEASNLEQNSPSVLQKQEYPLGYHKEAIRRLKVRCVTLQLAKKVSQDEYDSVLQEEMKTYGYTDQKKFFLEVMSESYFKEFVKERIAWNPIFKSATVHVIAANPFEL